MRFCLLGCLLLPTAGCGLLPESAAQTGPPRGRAGQSDQPPAVETQVVTTGTVKDVLQYTGTTQPVQQVVVRSQISGQIQSLPVDIGDTVAPGDLLALVDDALLRVEVNEAEAELASRQSEVAQAQATVSDGRTAVESAQVQLRQAKIEADRLKQLAQAGAISTQEAEQAQVTVAVAQQAVRSAEEQTRTRQQAVNAAQGRVESQRAVIAQAEAQLSYTAVRSPIAGVVLARTLDAGDFAQTGSEILQLGDLSAIEVAVQVSELDLARISRGQPVQVQLDAFPDQQWTGRITRISPVANATSRLIPVEVTIPNPAGRIGSGLLARVRFTPPGAQPVVVPESALSVGAQSAQAVVFVVSKADSGSTVKARSVQLGARNQGQVEILSGLKPGETIVIKGDRPLEDGQAVRLSILSDPPAGDSTPSSSPASSR